MGHKWKNFRLGVSRKNPPPTNSVRKNVEKPQNCPRFAMLCRTKCDEGGTLQESLTLAKVQQIDVVDQHNGSHGCNGGCDAWHSGSRKAIANLASLLPP